MPRIITTVLFLFTFLVALGTDSDSTFAYGADRDDDQQTSIVYVNRPVDDLTKTASHLFEGKDLKFITDPKSNVLILRGAKSEIQEAVEILKALDRPPATVTLEVTIAATNLNDKSKKPVVLDELVITALDDHESTLQFGQQVSLVAGIQRIGSDRGMVSRNYRQHATGTIIEARPRIMPEHILVDLQLEKSWYELSEDSEDEENPVTPTIYTASLNTTVQLTEGQTESVRTVVSGSNKENKEVVITLKASTKKHAAQVIKARKQATQSTGESSAQSSGRGRFGSSRSGDAATDRSRSGASRSEEGAEPQRAAKALEADDRAIAAAKRMMDRFDEDNNGKLNKAEWKKTGGFGEMAKSRGYDFTDEIDEKQLTRLFQLIFDRGR